MIGQLANKTGISEAHVRNILTLMEGGATVPFIARYRKEQTGGATDEQLRMFQEEYNYSQKLETRKEEVRRLIEERGKLTDTLRTSLEKADRLSTVEDLYRPFKEKRTTRAGLAIARGLEPLADLLLTARVSIAELRREAERFVTGDITTVDDAIAGAKDIVAERYSDTPSERQVLRKLAWSRGMLSTKKGKEFDPRGVYARHVDRSEPVSSIPSHRYLAIMRATREKQLTVKLTLDLEPSSGESGRPGFPSEQAAPRPCCSPPWKTVSSDSCSRQLNGRFTLISSEGPMSRP